MRELLIILAIALVLFGAKRLRSIGSDLGSALRGFKDAMAAREDTAEQLQATDDRRGPASLQTERDQQSS